MNNLVETFQNLDWKIKAIVAAVILVAVYYLYNYFMAKKDSQDGLPMPEFYGEGEGEFFQGPTLTCTMYYVNWCPHCQNAKPEWEKLAKDMNGKVVNGHKVLVLKVDCEQNPDVAKAQGITAFPTFKFDLDGKHYDYNDEAAFDKMKAFIQSIAVSHYQ